MLRIKYRDIVNSDEIKMFFAGCELLKLREAANSQSKVKMLSIALSDGVADS